MLLCPGTAKTDTHTPKMNRSESERKRKDTPEWHLIFMWFKHNSKGIAVVFPAFRMSSPLFGWFSGCVKMLSLSVSIPLYCHFSSIVYSIHWRWISLVRCLPLYFYMGIVYIMGCRKQQKKNRYECSVCATVCSLLQ